MIFISTFLFSQNEISNSKEIQLVTSQTEFKAGDTIKLLFSATGNTKPTLYCSTTYGSTLLNPSFEDSNILSFEIPSSISNKIGILNWVLLIDDKQLSGKLKITPKTWVASMETYLGPPSIEAGGTDFSMLVVIPTDSLDNPLKKGTPVQTKYQFLSREVEKEVKTNNLIAYKKIYSPNKSGRMIISSESLKKNSKEFDVNVMPAIPVNFKISSKRNHTYADGNQITSFISSIITDKLGNIVSDGTYVDFYIYNKDQNILKTSGTTIQGIATAKMIHPDHEEQWSVKAYVEGMAESNTIQVTYKQVITDFIVLFSKNNRVITIGPLKSFMNQMIPDGLQVNLTILVNNKITKIISKTSINGFVKFELKRNVYSNNVYSFQIETARVLKSIPNKKLW